MKIDIHWLSPNSEKPVVAVKVGDGFGSIVDLGLFSGDECRDLAQRFRDTAFELDPQEDDR